MNNLLGRVRLSKRTGLSWSMRFIGAFAIFLGMAWFGGNLPADAYVLNGCKFPGTNPSIVYEFHSVTSTWQTAFNVAQAAWDDESPGWGGVFVSGTSENIPVYDASYSASWQGLATGGCASGGGQTWINLANCPAPNPCVRIQFNTRTTGNEDATERKNIAVHELGHALGLAHSSLGCSNPVVMRSDANWAHDNCGSTLAPYPNDLAGLDAIY